MTPEQAMLVVAKKVLADRLDCVWDWWESYPEIGEDDWDKVTDLAVALAPEPDPAEYTKAYALLESRAEHAA